MTLTEESVENYFKQRPYYYTDDGTHFYANPSYRKMKSLHYVGRYIDAKEARLDWQRDQQILRRIRNES